jgi:hypothetical protein
MIERLLVVEELPATGVADKVYLVPVSSPPYLPPSGYVFYDEYAWVDTDHFELVARAALISLSKYRVNYYTKEETDELLSGLGGSGGGGGGTGTVIHDDTLSGNGTSASPLSAYGNIIVITAPVNPVQNSVSALTLDFTPDTGNATVISGAAVKGALCVCPAYNVLGIILAIESGTAYMAYLTAMTPVAWSGTQAELDALDAASERIPGALYYVLEDE